MVSASNLILLSFASFECSYSIKLFNNADFFLHHHSFAKSYTSINIYSSNNHCYMFSTFFFCFEQEARQAAKKARDVPKVDERVNKAVAAANKAANAARVAAVKAVQKQMHNNNDDPTLLV